MHEIVRYCLLNSAKTVKELCEINEESGKEGLS